GIRVRSGMNLDGLEALRLGLLEQGTDLGTWFRAGEHAFGVAGRDPSKATGGAGLLHRHGLVGGVAQDDHGSRRGQLQLQDQRGAQLGLGTMHQALVLAVGFGVVAALLGDARATRAEEQAPDEGVTALAGLLVGVIASPLAWPAVAVAGGEGIGGLGP